MSNTRKRYNDGYYRKPKGRKRALTIGARPRSVPPNPWDDINFDKSMYIPFKVARRIKKAGRTRVAAEKTLKEKFKLSVREINNILKSWDDSWF